MPRIAVAGPDGAGKTSICAALGQRLEGARVVYAGKKSNHLLTSTAVGLRLWKNARRFGTIPSLLTQHFVFYPLEFLENLKRFSLEPPVDGVLVYDRHPVDRMILAPQLRVRRERGLVARNRFLLEYPLCLFWGSLYRALFPLVDRLYVLLPEPHLCFQRAQGQYSTVSDARIRLDSYRMALNSYKRGASHVRRVPVAPNVSIDDICDYIMQDIKDAGEQVR